MAEPDSKMIRAAIPADTMAIQALLGAAGLPFDDIDPVWTDFFVMPSGVSIIGCVGLEIHGASALLRSLAVSPASRLHGAGRQLVEHVIRHAGMRGVADIYLLTTDAAGYFGRFGFVKIARSHAPETMKETSQFKSQTCSSAAVMHRRVTTNA